MKALARLPAVQGIAAMNSINVMAVMLAYHVPSNNALAAVELGRTPRRARCAMHCASPSPR